MGDRINLEAEFRFLLAYAGESALDEEICRDQLRMLWTAFCLHHNYDVDTKQYDERQMTLWTEVQNTGDGTSEWEDYDAFANFLAKFLC